MRETPDLAIDLSDHVATVEIRRPPHNFFDFALVQQLADSFETLDSDPACRAIVLCSEGKNFCAGANFGDGAGIQADGSVEGAPNREGVQHLYVEAVRLYRTGKPVVAAIQGAAIGGGLGLAMVADFRVGCPESRFAANFTRLGFHPGFGLTVTLPRVIGQQRAALMFLTSRRVRGDEAHEWGLLDAFTMLDHVRDTAMSLAREIAVNAPLGTVSTRATLRAGLADAVRAATDHELAEQTRLRRTEDFREGIAASADRREPDFKGR
ncbi:MAG TPA: enoyl-CoA hydratase/isomerase family protein [Thermohalobaculum sp.]|nr:enoyl-CoA hydratase/isomerase family protein [Thermohalobaculum sp.]